MIRTLLFLVIMMICKPLMAAEIIDIRTGNHPDKVRLVIEMTGEANFNAKMSTGNSQLIITLPLKSTENSHKKILPKPFLSPQYKNLQDQYTQLSVPLTSQHIIKTAFMLEGKPHRLVIDLIADNNQSPQTQTFGPLVVDTSQLQITTKPRKLIIIDAGHGGRDPGAVSAYGIKEKDITLALAKTIKKVLENSNHYDVLMTRNDDRFLPLQDRVAFAQENKGNLFLSIHADSIDVTSVSGASVYTLSDVASDAQTAKLAQRENKSGLLDNIDDGTLDSSITTLLIDLSVKETQSQSQLLAKKLVGGLQSHSILLLDDPHRYAAFAVLKAPDIPSVLIEAGFVSNKAQVTEMMAQEFQDNVAQGVLTALNQYFGYDYD